MGTQKINCRFKKNAYLSVSAVMFCKQFLLMLWTSIGLLSYAIHRQSCRSEHIISVLTTCTFMFPQVCIIEHSFFIATSGMYRRPIEGRHLVFS